MRLAVATVLNNSVVRMHGGVPAQIEKCWWFGVVSLLLLDERCASGLIECSFSCINLLKPTGHVMHQQFNIQQLYALPTLYLCVLYLSENKQRLVPLTA